MDREKVIKAIDICLGHGNCDDCGYKIKGGYSTMDCRKPMMRDALALLKEQKAVKPKKGLAITQKAWFCGVCDFRLNTSGKFCAKCGREVKWE